MPCFCYLSRLNKQEALASITQTIRCTLATLVRQEKSGKSGEAANEVNCSNLRLSFKVGDGGAAKYSAHLSC
tara:strand:+ start:2226 stop:2441 length:216 start_codon:yes stop_codon:yes gene_type:complete